MPSRYKRSKISTRKNGKLMSILFPVSRITIFSFSAYPWAIACFTCSAISS